MSHPSIPPESDLRATIERLVREALRAVDSARPLSSTAGPSSSTGEPGAATSAAGSAVASSDDAVVLTDRVVSVAVVERLGAGAKAVVLSPGAVLTPAAADLLKERGVRCARRAPATANGSTPAKDASTERNCWVADANRDAEARGRARAVARQMMGRGWRAETVGMEELARRATPDAPAIVVADLPAVPVDRLGRESGLCTVAVDSVELVRKIASQMRPAAWVIDAGRLSTSGIIAVAIECQRSGAWSGGEHR